MKKLFTLLLSLLSFCGIAQERASDDALEKEIVAKAHNTPAYKKAVIDVNAVRKDIELASKGVVKNDYVVKDYNARLGKPLGKKQTLRDVKVRIDNDGDTYIKYILSREVVRIATEEAKIATEEAKKRGN